MDDIKKTSVIQSIFTASQYAIIPPEIPSTFIRFKEMFRLFWKYAYSLSGQDLDEKIDTTFMCVE